MRAFFANGMDKILIPLPRAVEGLPALLHLSVFLFFAGLLIFLFNISHAVFFPVTSWIALFLMVYGCITLMPVFRHDSPYYAPFSSVVWLLYAGIQYCRFAIATFITSQTCIYDTDRDPSDLKDRYRRWMSGGIRKAVEEAVSELSPKIDLRILEWTLRTLGGDDSLERFFQSIPDFFQSKLVRNLGRNFSFDLANMFLETLCGFLNRTLSSNSVPEDDKTRRLTIYRDVMDVIPGPIIASRLLDDALRDRQIEASQSIETAKNFALWFENTDQEMSQFARERVVGILVNVQERDDRWKKLASKQFGLTENDIQSNIDLPNDSVLLYLLNHVVRQATETGSFSASILSSLSDFTIIDTDLELRREFCHLWNANVDKARDQGANNARPIEILRQTRHLFFALHQGTTAEPTRFTNNTGDDDYILFQPRSYSTCRLSDHAVPATHPHHHHAHPN